MRQHPICDWVFDSPTRVKSESSDHKMFRGHALSIVWRKDDPKNWLILIVLYGYHFTMDFKIFLTVDQGRDKWPDTARVAAEDNWRQNALSTMAAPTSSIVSFEISLSSSSQHKQLPSVFKFCNQLFKILSRHSLSSVDTVVVVLKICCCSDKKPWSVKLALRVWRRGILRHWLLAF